MGIFRVIDFPPAVPIPRIIHPTMDLKPCRDCGTPVQWTSRSCPHCGIMNPVHQWVALPDGEHERFRVPVNAYGAMAASARSHAVLSTRPKDTLERIFGSVDSPEEAKEAVDWCSGVMYLLAGIHLLAAVFLGPAQLVDAGVLIVLSTWLRMRDSRVAATLLLVLSAISVLAVATTGSFRIIWLSLIAAGLSWRAFNATAMLHPQRR